MFSSTLCVIQKVQIRTRGQNEEPCFIPRHEVIRIPCLRTTLSATLIHFCIPGNVATAERNSTKLDKQQDLNVLYHV